MRFSLSVPKRFEARENLRRERLRWLEAAALQREQKIDPNRFSDSLPAEALDLALVTRKSLMEREQPGPWWVAEEPVLPLERRRL